MKPKCRDCDYPGEYANCCGGHYLERVDSKTEGVKLVDIVKAKDGKHKFVAIFNRDGKEKRVPFGAEGYDDVTITKDLEQMERYKFRHKKDLLTYDPTKPGYLSYYILWGSPNFKKNVSDYKKMFNL